MVGGFVLIGTPLTLIDELTRLDLKELTVISNNIGVAGKGLGILLDQGKLKKAVGLKALEDNRGKRKPSEAQTIEEQLKAEIEALRVRNQWSEIENDTLKKQEQMERKLMAQESDKKPRTKRLKH